MSPNPAVPSAGPRSRIGEAVGAVEVLSWIVVAGIGAVLVSEAVGWAGTESVAVVQTLTPYLGFCLLPIVAVAMWRRRLLLATVATAVGIGIAVLGTPLAWPNPQPPPAAGSTGLRVATANLWYENTRIGDVDEVMADLDADVIVFNEYTPQHEASLLAGPLADAYPYRTGVSGPGAMGDSVWSRIPFAVAEPPAMSRNSLDVTVHGPDGDIRVVAVHMPTPIIDFPAWRRDLGTAADIGRTATGPTLLIGDLNSSYWHPDFRLLLDAGFVDAHIASGRGFSASWPANRRFPAFVRLDHALSAGGLVSTEVVDFDIPGSDHRGLMVTVAPTRRAEP